MYVTTSPMYWCYMELLSSVHFRSSGMLPTCSSALRGINTCGYYSITCLTVLWIPLLTSYKRIQCILGIPFLRPFLGLLGYKFLQKTTVGNPWGFLLLLKWLQDMTCSKHRYCLPVNHLCWTLLWDCPYINV